MLFLPIHELMNKKKTRLQYTFDIGFQFNICEYNDILLNLF